MLSSNAALIVPVAGPIVTPGMVKIEPMFVAENMAATPPESMMIVPVSWLAEVTLTNVPRLSVRFFT